MKHCAESSTLKSLVKPMVTFSLLLLHFVFRLLCMIYFHVLRLTTRPSFVPNSHQLVAVLVAVFL